MSTSVEAENKCTHVRTVAEKCGRKWGNWCRDARCFRARLEAWTALKQVTFESWVRDDRVRFWTKMGSCPDERVRSLAG